LIGRDMSADPVAPRAATRPRPATRSAGSKLIVFWWPTPAGRQPVVLARKVFVN
jgi:hypothetical protein